MRVKISEEEAPSCGMESIQLHPQPELDQVQAPVQAEGKGKEIGMETLFVKMKGSKKARRTAEGGRLGGLAWTNEEMAIAAGKNYSVYSVSLAAAGAIAASYLRSKAEAIYVKALEGRGTGQTQTSEQTSGPPCAFQGHTSKKPTARREFHAICQKQPFPGLCEGLSCTSIIVRLIYYF
jgi:hypothetical protein